MRDKKGFTLIELLIVVVIIGILAAIAIPKFAATREKAYFAAMKSDLKNLMAQEEIYYSDTYSYSDVATDLDFVQTEGVNVTIAEATGTGWSATATHEALGADQGCAVYYGDAADPGGNATPAGPGAIACSDAAVAAGS